MIGVTCGLKGKEKSQQLLQKMNEAGIGAMVSKEKGGLISTCV